MLIILRGQDWPELKSRTVEIRVGGGGEMQTHKLMWGGGGKKKNPSWWKQNMK